MNNIPPEVTKYILMASVVVFGAIANATSQFKIAKDGKCTYTRTDFVVNFIIATFAGMVFGLGSSLFFTATPVIILFSAVGAFLGLAGLNRFTSSLLEFLVNKTRQ